jgi:hypothetical protein
LAAIGEIAASIQEPLRKVKTAYEIMAYPYCKQEGRRFCIESALESDRQAYGRDQVELNDEELGMLSKLAAVRRMTFDPQKRIYNYSEVPLSPYINPYGRRHMKTDEIRKWLNEEPVEPNK